MQKLFCKFFVSLLLTFAAFSANALTASFTADHTSGCTPLPVHFTNTSTGATSYIWKFGNGSPNSTSTNTLALYYTGTYTVTLVAYYGTASDSMSMVITVPPKPIVSFHSISTTVCASDTVFFVNTTTEFGPTTYLWDFGNGDTSTNPNPRYVYSQPGYHTVTLIASDTLGCDTSITRTAYIFSDTAINAGFNVTRTYFCKAPAVEVFTSTSTGGTHPYTFLWHFGNGDSSFATSPTYTYTVAGSDTATLTITDAHGCTKSFSRIITISVPYASFTADTGLCANFSDTFTNTSFTTVPTNTYRWLFGDGIISTLTSPVHTYTASGTYTVSLTTNNGQTCRDTVKQIVTVWPVPSSGITATPASPCPPSTTINYTSTGTSGDTVNWYFGDGAMGTGTSISNTYTSAELDTVAMVGGANINTLKIDTTTMIVINPYGCRDTVTHVDTIRDLILVFGLPGYGGCVPLTRSFSISAITTVPFAVGPYPFAIVSYTWNFGDGSATSTGATPSHTYTAAGSYALSCTVTTANGCTATETTGVSVGTPSTVSLTASPSHVCVGSDVGLTAIRTSGFSTSYFWNFGDGQLYQNAPYSGGSDGEPHSYTTPGTYHVTVTIANGGCSGNTASATVIVDSPAAIIGLRYDCAGGNTVTLYNNSIGADSVLWTLSDATTSTADTLVHTFAASSNTATLWVRNIASGCSNTISVPIDIYQITPSFTADDTAICRDMVVHFTPYISGGVPDSVYTWLVNGANTATSTPVAPLFTDTFHSTGIYTVSIVTHDIVHGCWDTASRSITVAKPVANFTVSPISGCSPLPVTFTNTSTDVAGITFTNFQWQFGDGSTPVSGSSPTVVHTYSIPNTITSAIFTDTLIVTDNIGCKDTLVLPDVDTVMRVRANFSSPSSVCLGSTITFTNTSTSPFGDGRSYYWTFGDATNSTVTSLSHLYGTVGNYTVALYTTDTVRGCIDSFKKIITVSHPTAAFTMSDSTALCAPLTVYFTNTSTGIPATGSNSEWTFGNGNTSIIRSPNATYTSPGIHTVQLIVTNAQGCKDTAYGHVTLFGYSGDFSYDTMGCMPFTAHFATIAGTGADSVTWIFGDDSIVNTSSSTISHIYTHGGIYTPTVILGNATGCNVASSGSVAIRVDSVAAHIATSPNPVCPNTNITFTGTGNSYFSTVTGWHWQFAGSDTSNLNPAIYSYSLSGTYVASVIATDGWGCTTTATDTILIYPVPGPIIGIDSLCVGSSFPFSDTTTGGVWISDDQAIAGVGGSGIVTGVSAGTTTISYIVTNVFGCSAILTFPITILALPDSGVISGIDSVCIGSTTPLAESVPGGVWSSSDTTIASIDAFGTVSGITLGVVTISYTVHDSFCSNVAIFTFKVVTLPAVPPITGFDTLCVIGSDQLFNAFPGGVWSSLDPSIAFVDAVTGVVSGVSIGFATIAYDVTNACGTTQVTKLINVIPLDPPIFGPHSVCSGSTIPLNTTVGGGTWTSDDPTIADVDVVTGVVTGISTGTTMIRYTGVSACGPYSVEHQVSVNTAPYITTNSMVACQTLSSTKAGPQIISGSGDCIKVCDSTIVRYYGNGVSGSVYTWAIAGGTIVQNYGDSIDVFWPAAGTMGSITVTDTFSHCIGTASACILVIQRPHAYFTASAINVCAGNTVYFTNLSTADPLSPIVSYHWDFGDGTGSVSINPSHVYSTAGINAQVTLVVRNACNCSDTFRLVLILHKDPGVQITCPAAVCDSEFATYSIPASGCAPAWNVTSGSIISGNGTPSIVVQWDASGGGFGTVNVTDPCAACIDTSTIKIPIIADAPISGPSVVCTDKEYEYTLPLWPGTQYQWGVLGFPSVKVMYSNDYRLVVNFPAPGTYTLHAWYQNEIKMCGGNVFRTITVQQTDSILGNTTVCPNSPETYSLIGGATATWTVSDMAGTVIATATGTSFTNTFTASGTYLLTATGAFCSDPLTINVLNSPPAVDSVHGQDTVCLNYAYTYTAYSDVPGTIYEWQAIGGFVIPSTGSPVVTAVWSGGSPMMLIVSRVSTIPPYCSGPSDTINIMQEVINPYIIGDTVVCANSSIKYYTDFTRGEWYEWTVYPTTAGSVILGEHTPIAHILWNNVPGITPATADVVLTVHKCDSVFTDTAHIVITPTPPVTLTITPNPTCPGSAVAFTSTVGGLSYAWNFGDGTPILITMTNTATHVYPPNLTTGIISYPAQVTVLPDYTFHCPISGVAGGYEDVLPGPVAYAYSTGPISCDTTAFIGTVTDNVGTISYQWYKNGTAVTGATGPTFHGNTPGMFSFTATCANGCFDTSNYVHADSCNSDTITCVGVQPIVLNATITAGCNSLHLAGTTTGLSPRWGLVSGGVLDTAVIAPGLDADVVCMVPGIYDFVFSAVNPYDTCDSPNVSRGINRRVIVPLVADYLFSLHCGTGGYDTVLLQDHSSFLPGYLITGIDWINMTTGTMIGTGWPNLSVALLAPGTYQIVEYVYYIDGSDPLATVQNCSVIHTIVLPSAPTASFTSAVSPICSQVPITFTPTTSGGIVQYNWDFGDGSGSLLTNPQRAYTWNITDPDPLPESVTLTVTDTIGCTATAVDTVEVRRNRLSGDLGGNVVACSDNAPVVLGYTSVPGFATPTSYLWSTGATSDTIAVDTSGAYWLTVYGAYQCQFTTFPATQVGILKVPSLGIVGAQSYCEGDTVRLSGYVGNSVIYEWYRDGSPDGTLSSVADGGLPAGTYVYQLVRTLMIGGVPYCTDTLADTIQIYKLPKQPKISGPIAIDCATYQIELDASAGVSGTFNWSDGTAGAINTNIYTGGPYEVWFTDINGCQSSNTVSVPPPPSWFFQYFPSGCYTVCVESLPQILYGPPNQIFDSWEWQEAGNPSPLSSGSMSPVAPYGVTHNGSYNWWLSNGLCKEASDYMDLSIDKCSNCGNGTVSGVLTCTAGNPASYTIDITVAGLPTGTTFTSGTDIGPIGFFSGVLTGTSPYLLSLTFTTLYLPPPSDMILKMVFTLPIGSKCYLEDSVSIPFCPWVAERSGDTSTTKTDGGVRMANEITSAMLVYPNPASGAVTVSFDYGTDVYEHRSLAVYDIMGRKIGQEIPSQLHDTWNVNTADWSPGIYIIRMEADGRMLHTQRVVVSH
ncbi:PKD domain-containing protein [Flavipsychrobacter stenotrophus]|nr:PKD domain-containing protein [Flavipsychrobacter stenotrophus]